MEHTPLKDRPWMPLAMAALGHIIWGFSVLFSKVAMEVAQPDVLLSIRFLLSALLMTLMILFGKAKVSLRGKNLKPLLLLAVTEPMYFYFESYGILYTNATFAGVVLAVAPVVAILLSVLFLKEYPTRRQAVFCLLPVAGVMLMTVSGSSMGIIRPLGVVFLMGACLTSGAYKTVNRRTAQEFTAFERTYVVMLACAAAFTARTRLAFSAAMTAAGDRSSCSESFRASTRRMAVRVESVMPFSSKAKLSARYVSSAHGVG